MASIKPEQPGSAGVDTAVLLSVVIPTLNEERNIGRCLQSLAEMVWPPGERQVVVVDNGSHDRTREIAQSFSGSLSIEVLCFPGITIGGLRNAGANQTGGKILAFLDADCSVAQDWATKALARLSGPVSVTGCEYRLPPDASWVAKTWDITIDKRRQEGWREFIVSGNLFVRRTAFDEVGGFDESLTTNEDFDLCARLRKAGYQVYSDPGVVAVHWGAPSSLGKFFAKHRWHGTSVLRVFLEDPERRKNRRAVAYALHFLVGTCVVIGSVPISLSARALWPTMLALGALLAMPAAVSARACHGGKCSVFDYCRLFLLFVVYGFARATSLLVGRHRSRQRRHS